MDSTQITAVILAGGSATRMGGRDKGLTPLQQRPMITHVIQRLAPQIERIVISANRNLEQYQTYGYPVLTDQTDGFLGPLSGFLSALLALQTPYLLTVPCDAPRIPSDYAQRMRACDSKLCAAHTNGKLQPTFALIHRDFTENLQTYLDQGHRAVGQWLRRNGCIAVDFSDQSDGFINLNHAEELSQWEQAIEQGQ